MLPIRNISYLLPISCSFWEKCKNSPKTDLGCSTPLSKLDANIKGAAHTGWYHTYRVSNCVNCAFIDPVRCHLGSMAVRSLRIVCATSAYADAKCLHRFGQFNAFLGMFLMHKFMLFRYFSDWKGMINLLLGSVSVWYGKFSCTPCHTGTQPVASPRYDTSRTRIYRIIPPLHLITNNLVAWSAFGQSLKPCHRARQHISYSQKWWKKIVFWCLFHQFGTNKMQIMNILCKHNLKLIMILNITIVIRFHHTMIQPNKYSCLLLFIKTNGSLKKERK